MNNLHRHLAPISEAAWAEIEEEAGRTFKRHIAGRRVVDVEGPHGQEFAAVGTGRLSPPSGDNGVEARLLQSVPLVQLRVPFSLSRDEIDTVERGSGDADWDPLKEAAKQIAFTEDRAIFDGLPGAGLEGMRPTSSNAPISLPASVADTPEAISQALSSLRLAGVDGPYTVVLGAELYTQVSEETSHGYPIREHISRLIDGHLVWAPAISGALVLTTRGGDFVLHLGQDLSIGYASHDADQVHLYFQESLAFLPYTSEGSVALSATLT